MIRVFVYGTLLKGMSRFATLARSQCLGHASTKGILYDLGPFPAIAEGNNDVYGELYSVTDVKLRELDRIEGYSLQDERNSLYIRKGISVTLLNDGSTENAYAYFYNSSLEGHRIIDHGDYRRFRLEASSTKQWYIAYGSNMSLQRLAERIGKTDEIKKGYLEGYKLRFNKKAAKGGSYANIAYAGPDFRCPFVAHRISKQQLQVLDRFEGEPSHYVRIGLPISDEKGESYFGHVYIANPKKLTMNESPSSDYLNHIYRGYEEHRFDTTSLPRLEK